MDWGIDKEKEVDLRLFSPNGRLKESKASVGRIYAEDKENERRAEKKGDKRKKAENVILVKTGRR